MSSLFEIVVTCWQIVGASVNGRPLGSSLAVTHVYSCIYKGVMYKSEKRQQINVLLVSVSFLISTSSKRENCY